MSRKQRARRFIMTKKIMTRKKAAKAAPPGERKRKGPTQETLAQLAKRYKKAILQKDTSLLRLAWELRSIVNRWETHYKEEAQGLSADSWLKQNLDRRLSYWKRRWSAVAAMGTDILQFMGDQSAVHLMRMVPDPEIRQRFVEIHSLYKKQNGGLPMPYWRTYALVKEWLGQPSRPQLIELPPPCKSCIALRERIKLLEAALVLNGVKIPPWDQPPKNEEAA
jgi:hypothetical protein